MEIYDVDGRRVYTHSANRVTLDQLKEARVEDGEIRSLYFFKIDEDRRVVKINPDDVTLGALKNGSTGLYVDLKDRLGNSSVAIAGLDRIIDFLGRNVICVEGLESVRDPVKIYSGSLTGPVYGFAIK